MEGTKKRTVLSGLKQLPPLRRSILDIKVTDRIFLSTDLRPVTLSSLLMTTLKVLSTSWPPKRYTVRGKRGGMCGTRVDFKLRLPTSSSSVKRCHSELRYLIPTTWLSVLQPCDYCSTSVPLSKPDGSKSEFQCTLFTRGDNKFGDKYKTPPKIMNIDFFKIFHHLINTLSLTQTHDLLLNSFLRKL